MSRIDPSQIPGADIDLSAVRTGASGLKGNGSTIRDGGADVVRDWQQLPGSFEVTGTASLYSAMAPVASDTQLVGDSLGAIARALTSFADAVEPIKARLDALRGQASAFVAKTNAFTPRMEMVSSGYTLGIPLPERVDSWNEDPGLSDENNSLIREVAAAEADWLDAQQRCADAIRAAVSLASTGGAAEQSLASQLRSGDALNTAWGSTSDRKESCSEKAITFQSHFLWDGVIVGFGWGTVKTLMTLGGTNPDSLWHAGQALLSGDWDGVLAAGREDLSAMGTAWLGVAHIASAIAIPISPAERMALLHSGALDWLPDSVKQGAEDWTAGDGTALYGTVAGLVGLTLPTKWWDPKAYKTDQVFKNWTDNPGGAAGMSVANIGSFFVPGVGEARGAGLAADAAKLADGARLGDLIADGSVASLKGLSADALQSTIKGLSEADAARLASELAKPELDAGALSALQLDDLTLHDPVEALPPQVAVDSDQAPGSAGDQPVTGAEPGTTPTVGEPEGAADTADSSSTADAAGPADSSAPAGAADAADSASPADADSPADAAAPGDAAEGAAPTEGAAPADAVATADEAAPADTAASAESVSPADASTPAGAADAGDAAGAADAATPANAADAGAHSAATDPAPTGVDAGAGDPAADSTGSDAGQVAHDTTGPHAGETGQAADSPAHSGDSPAPISNEDFQRLPQDEQERVAQAELDNGAKTYPTNADASQFGAATWNDYADALSQPEKTAIDEYTRELSPDDRAADPDAFDYREINAALRDGSGAPVRPDVQAAIDQLDKALAGTPVPETTVITRGTGIGHWGFDPLEGVGRTLTERSYTSTSLGGVAPGFDRYDAILHLQVPAGTPALWVERVGHFGAGERELLLGRGQEWTITRTVFDGHQWQIYGKLQ